MDDFAYHLVLHRVPRGSVAVDPSSSSPGPGPDLLYILGRCVSQGRAAGVVSALGIGAGVVSHVLAATFGLSGLVFALPHGYDDWFGGGRLPHRPRREVPPLVRRLAGGHGHGPQPLNGTLVCVVFALFASRLGQWLKRRFGVSRLLDRLTGGVFLGVGVRLALLERPWCGALNSVPGSAHASVNLHRGPRVAGDIVPTRSRSEELPLSLARVYSACGRGMNSKR